MMYHAFSSPTANALSGLGVCTLTSPDGTTCLIDTPDPFATGSGEAGTEGSGIPGSPSSYETPAGSSNVGTSNQQPYNFNYPAGYQSPAIPVGTPATGFNWGFLTPVASSLANIFGTRYAVPQLNPGQSISTGPGGTIITQQPAGVPVAGLPATVGGISTTSLLLFGGIGLVMVMLMKKK